MKISIRGDKEDSEPIMELFLEKDGKSILLRGTDTKGIDWTLLEVKDEGIHMYQGIPESTGWPIIGAGTGEIRLC